MCHTVVAELESGRSGVTIGLYDLVVSLRQIVLAEWTVREYSSITTFTFGEQQLVLTYAKTTSYVIMLVETFPLRIWQRGGSLGHLLRVLSSLTC